MQWDDYALSQAYEPYRVIIKAKEPDPSQPQMMFIESEVVYADGRHEGQPFDKFHDSYPYNMITYRYGWNCEVDLFNEFIRQINETVIEDQSYLGIKPDKIDVDALAETLEALGFQKN